MKRMYPNEDGVTIMSVTPTRNEYETSVCHYISSAIFMNEFL